MTQSVSQEKKSGFSGLRVVSFESRRAFEMESLIERHGGAPLSAPSLREIPFEINQEALEFARKVARGEADALILMTGVGTRFLVQVIEKSLSKDAFVQALSKIMLVARGPKSVAALKELGLSPAITAAEPNTWREVLAALDKAGPLKDKKVFVQEYGMEKQEFIAELKKRGARVGRVPVYRWALPEDLNPLRNAILAVSDGKADVLLFTNATQIDHVLRVAGEEGLETSFREGLARVAVASIGPVASENLANHGLPVDFEPQESKMGLFVKEAAEKCPAIVKEKRERWEKGHGLKTKIYPVQPYANDACKDSPFMKACRREKAAYTPVWLMRQAGRYMKEYRDVRAKVSFLDLCKNPDLACEVTVTAQERIGADAAIIFSDILVIVEPMGVGLEYTRGEGPYIHRPIRSVEDVDKVREVVPEESLGFVFEALKKTRSALKPNIPLIGFAGAPFTVVSYMVEGKGSSNYMHTKKLMYGEPKAWHKLMDKVTQSTVRYINGQIAAGAQTVQIFDSWIGCLSPEDYREFVFPHMKTLFSSLKPGTPAIHFGTGTATLLEMQRDAGGTVIGLDWRMPFRQTWERLGDVAVQGNLDPMVLLSDFKTVKERAKKILDEAAGKPGHIFNLGHGILPQTPVENVIGLIDFVHEYTAKK